jgi:DNA-binding response OmpR family regulator
MSAHAFALTSTHTAVLKNLRVLVVEDEALIAMLVEDALLEAGAKVLVAASVADALRLVDMAAGDGGLSAAVLDINLGGEVVMPVADALASLGVPFLFTTGYGEGCDRGQHAAAPMLEKPFGPQDLIAAMGTIVSAPSPQPQVSGHRHPSSR